MCALPILTMHAADIAADGERAVHTLYAADLRGAKVTQGPPLRMLEGRQLRGVAGDYQPAKAEPAYAAGPKPLP